MFKRSFLSTNRLLAALVFLSVVLSLSAKKTHHLRNAHLQMASLPVSPIDQLLESGEKLQEQEKWRESIPYLLQADQLDYYDRDTASTIRTKATLYNAYYKLGVLDSANYYLNQMLQYAKRSQDTESEMQAWNYKAILFQTDLEFDSAHVALSKAYDLAVQLHDKKAQANFSSNLGIVFGQQGQYKKAEDYFRQAFDLGQASKDTLLIALGANNLSRVFTEAAQYDSATYYSNKAYEYALAVRAEHPHYYYKAIDFQALLAMRKGDLEYAEKKYLQLAGIYRNLEETISLAEVYSRLAELNLDKKNAQAAIKYAQYTLDLLHNIPANEVREKALLVLSQAYGDIRDFQKAYQFAEQYRMLRDSVYNEKLAELVTELNQNFELANKERENAQLLIESQRNKVARNYWIIFALVSGLILVLALGIIVFFLQKIENKKRLNRRLEGIVQERTAALWESNRKLKSYVDELHTFTHISSHDLKEPLRNISGFVSLLEKKIGADLDEQSLEFMGYIKQNAAHMHELLEDVLAYSTIENRPSPTKPVVLSNTMIKVKGSLQTLIEEKKAVIIYDELPEIIANETQLFMILKNLVENGIKYNHSTPPKIKVTYHRQPKTHLIRVEDNGIGIPTEYREQIFQLFKRLHNRTEFAGTGMGLSISRKIAQRQGGQLRVANSNTQGTVFELRLPLAKQEFATPSS